MKKYVCLDIGGTSIKHGVIDHSAVFLEHAETATVAYQGGAAVLKKVIGIIEQYQKRYELAGICISTAGVVDFRNGEILHAGITLPGYTGIAVKQQLEDHFQMTCRIENDVNCVGLAEHLSGAARGCASSLCLTVGTGIGGSVIIDNKIFHGFTGSAGEVGYMHLDGGTFEELGSADALVKKVAAKKHCAAAALDGRIIFELAGEGDAICILAIDEMVDVLGRGIANICFVINPEIVVLGGGIMNQQEYLYDRVNDRMKHYLSGLLPAARMTRLAFAEHGNCAGMLGAFFHFMSTDY